VCGNGRVDHGEVCDDANDVAGDGCSVACLSDESCGNGITDATIVVDGLPFPAEQCDDGNAMGRDGCSNGCRFETPSWTLMAFAPSERDGAAMTYDAAHDRVLMFGGRDQASGFLAAADLWQWTGVGWSSIPTFGGPSQRWRHGVAYDASARTLVLFGGQISSPVGVTAVGFASAGDTWLWNGTSWTYVASSTVRKRAGHAMIYDAARGKVMLYGGERQDFGQETPTVMSDTWEWDGNAWSASCDGCAPGARVDHAMAFDPARGVTWMFGGLHKGGFAEQLTSATQTTLGDLWRHDAAGWTQVPTSAGSWPPARSHALMSYDALSQRVVLAGGTGAGDLTLTDTWTWDGQSWTEVTASGAPAPHRGVASDPRRGIVTNPSPGTMRWQSGTWSSVPVGVPSSRSNAAVAYHSLRGQAVMFGGRTDSSETWLFEGDTWMESATSPAPSPRYNHAMAFHEDRREVLLFGGEASSGRFGDTWTWNGAWSQESGAVSPSARSWHAMAYDGSRVIMFGGLGTTTFADTWAWDGSWQLIGESTPGLAGRWQHVMAYDPVRRVVVLFGGTSGLNNAALLDDTWLWDGSHWTRLDTTPPPPRTQATLTWHPARQRLVLFGGENSGRLDDAWEFDGSSWSPLYLSSRPPPSAGHAAWSLSHGIAMCIALECWRLRWESAEPVEACHAGADTDGDLRPGCDDPDCWAGCTPLCPPGVSCAAGLPRCGDAACNTAIESCTSCPEDCTCTPVCGDFRCEPGETAATCAGDC
jgi:cysteine-rich repeat protein